MYEKFTYFHRENNYFKPTYANSILLRVVYEMKWMLQKIVKFEIFFEGYTS